MNNIKKYHILTKDKPFAYKVKIAFLLLKEDEVYEELKEEASKDMIREGQPCAIFERIIGELLNLKVWYIPDEIKIWDRRFGSLFETKYFCYDYDAETWTKILNKYFVELRYMPIRENYSSTRSFNNAWGYFAELLAVVKENNHSEFSKYYEIAIKNGMSDEIFKRKLNELSEIKKSFREL